MAAIQGTASFSAGVVFTPKFTSTFLLLQALLDKLELGNTRARNDALEFLIAYHAATLSNDKYSAVVNMNKIHARALLYLDHMWNVYGPAGLPIDAPSHAALSELTSAVSTARTNASYTPLAGPA